MPVIIYRSTLRDVGKKWTDSTLILPVAARRDIYLPCTFGAVQLYSVYFK
jgi:hypothetical protein